MLGRSSYQIASAATPDVYLTDKSQLIEYLQGSVNCYQSNFGVALLRFAVYAGRGKMVSCGGEGTDYRPALRSELVSVLPQTGYSPLLADSHTYK